MNTASGIAIVKSKLSRLSLLLSTQRSSHISEIKNYESMIDFLKASCKSIETTTSSLNSKLAKIMISESRNANQRQIRRRSATPAAKDSVCRGEGRGMKKGSVGHIEDLGSDEDLRLKIHQWSGSNTERIRDKISNIGGVGKQNHGQYELRLKFKGNLEDLNPINTAKSNALCIDQTRRRTESEYFLKKSDWTPRGSYNFSIPKVPNKRDFSKTMNLNSKFPKTPNDNTPRSITHIASVNVQNKNYSRLEENSPDLTPRIHSQRKPNTRKREISLRKVKQTQYKEDITPASDHIIPKSFGAAAGIRKQSIPISKHDLDKSLIPSPISTVKHDDQSYHLRPEPAFSETYDRHIESAFMTDSNMVDDIPIDNERVKRTVIGNISSPYEIPGLNKMPLKHTGYNLSFKNLVSVQHTENRYNPGDSCKSRTMADLLRMCEASPIGNNPFIVEQTSGKMDQSADRRDTPNWMNINIDSFKDKTNSSEHPSVAGFDAKTNSLIDNENMFIREFQPSFAKKDEMISKITRKKKGLTNSIFHNPKEIRAKSKQGSRLSHKSQTKKTGNSTNKNTSIGLESTLHFKKKSDLTAESLLRNLIQSVAADQ